MLIRSQDGRILLNVSQVACFRVIDDRQIWAFFPNDQEGFLLGEYSGWERADEVMLSIETKYITYTLRDAQTNPDDLPDCVIFQMPTE